MTIRQDVLEAIGDTPLIRLRQASELTGCTILGKAEFMNPGQSVKDRAALFIVRDAERNGLLRPGGVIVEGTAGNTGIGLALVGNALGYRTVIVIPDTQSQEKKDMLRLAGADLVEVPAVPYADPNNYVKVSGRLAERLARSEPNGAVWANQFDNVANRQGALPRRECYRQKLVASSGMLPGRGASWGVVEWRGGSACRRERSCWGRSGRDTELRRFRRSAGSSMSSSQSRATIGSMRSGFCGRRAERSDLESLDGAGTVTGYARC